MLKRTVLLLFLAPVLMIPTADAAQEKAFKNLRQIATDAGFYNYRSVTARRTLKVAILDNGFKGYEEQIGKTLPSDTQYHAGPVSVDAKTEESHGLAMAQIVSGLLTEAAPRLTYELHLFSAFGFSNLKSAVETVARDKFDVVLYSQVWEYGGNGDGRGFVNHVVNQAAQSGALWINAAGNVGNGTYRGKIEKGTDDWAKLPGANNGVAVRCQKNSKNKCMVRVVLSWNDFSDDSETGTDKDLDLVLTDDASKIVGTSALTQMKQIPEGTAGASLYPREIIQTEVKPGLYYVRAKIRSSNFDKKHDELRVTVSGDFVQLQNASKGETLLSPADNENVITVGASDSEKSSFSKLYSKPELLVPSEIIVSEDETFKGSSNSAAITAAGVTLLKAVQPNLTRTRVLALLGANGGAMPLGEGAGLPLELLGFGPTSRNCFKLTTLPFYPRALQELIDTETFIVETTHGPKIFTTDDPFELLGRDRVDQDDMLIVRPEGFDQLPRSSQPFLPQGVFEVVQQPAGQTICSRGTNRGPIDGVYASHLRMPRPTDVR